MLKNKKRLFLIIILLIAVGIFFYMRRPQVIEVKPISLENLVVRKTISASGVTVSKSEADLAFSSSGQLQNLFVIKGQEVTKGALVGNIYNYDSSQSSKSLKDLRDVAIRDLDIYKETYEDDKDAAGGEDQYYLNLRRLQELVDKGEASYQSSLGTLSKTYLYAPFTGTAVDVFFDQGEQVIAGQSVVKLADLNNLEFDISIDQEDFGFLSLDQDVEVTLDSYEHKIFAGKVIELPKYVDNSTEEFKVKIAIEQNNNEQVLLGMNGDASIIVAQTFEPVNALPFDAVITEKDKHFVWVNSGGVLRKEEITIGLEGDIYTQVTSDLAGKELVSPKKGTVEAVEGLKVRILAE